MLIIAITGGSGSGKSLIASGLLARLGMDRALLLEEDSYYADLPPNADPAQYNFDDLTAKDRDLLYQHLVALKQGDGIERPSYDFVTHKRQQQTTFILPKPILIIEGSHVAFEAKFRALYDCLIYIDTPDDLRLARRLLRDINERGRTPDCVIDQYIATVRPMHQAYTLPAKVMADLVFENAIERAGDQDPIHQLLDEICGRVETMSSSD